MFWRMGVWTVAMILGACPAVFAGPLQGLLPAEEWATPLSEGEMDGIRGGFNGLAFNVMFSGYYTNVGQVEGSLAVDTTGTLATGPVPTPTPSATVQNGQVNISTSVGNFNGSSGIFQITQVPGNFNVVNNNLFVQIAMVNLQPGSRLPSLTDLFRP